VAPQPYKSALAIYRIFSFEYFQQISFYSVRLSASRPTPNLEDHFSVFIPPGDRVVQLYPWTLGSSGTSGSPFPVPTCVGPWGLLQSIYRMSVNGFFWTWFLLLRATLSYTYKTRTNWKTNWKGFMNSNLSLIKFNVSSASGSSYIKPIFNLLPYTVDNSLISVCTPLWSGSWARVVLSAAGRT
jgi:hypothetical protein